MSTTSSDVDADAAADALDRLVESEVVSEADDGTLSTTASFEETRGVYYDTYMEVSEAQFHDSVADLFGVSSDEAATYIEEHDVSREEFVAYLALQSYLDESVDRGTTALMARLVLEIGPETPVPEPLVVLDDETYEAFIEENPDAVLTVWRHYCDPCDRMKEDLDAILDEVPDGVAVAGLDGESVPRFRLEFAVDSAPAVLFVRDGELVEVATGQGTPEMLAERFDAVYGDGDSD